MFVFYLRFMTSLFVPSESALAQPPSSFSILLLWCRFRYESLVLQFNVGARPLALDAPSGNSPRALPYVLAPPMPVLFTGSRARTNPARKRAGLPASRFSAYVFLALITAYLAPSIAQLLHVSLVSKSHSIPKHESTLSISRVECSI